MVMGKRRKTPKIIKLHLASAGRGGQRMTKKVLTFCFLLAALNSCLPGELPPPRSQPPASSPELSPTAMAPPGLCTLESWTLGTPQLNSRELDTGLWGHPILADTPLSSLQCITAFLLLLPACTRPGSQACAATQRHSVGQANTRGALQRWGWLQGHPFQLSTSPSIPFSTGLLSPAFHTNVSLCDLTLLFL